MADIIFEGQLMKKGKLNKAWKHRWCELLHVNGDLYLQYFDSKIDANLCGSIELKDVFGIEVIGFEDYDLFTLSQIPKNVLINSKIKCEEKYSFILNTVNRNYIFAAFDPKNFGKWLSIFSRYIYSGIIKEGWLEKRGEKNKAWKRRYFVLNQFRQIKYYQDEAKRTYAGSIALNEVIEINVAQSLAPKENKYTFQLMTDKRTWILCANAMDERKSWFEEIEKWRKAEVVNKKQRLLSDDMKEIDDDDEDLDAEDSKDQIYPLHSSGEEESEDDDIEQFECTACGKIYASQWPKCPNCFRRDSHIKKPSTGKLSVSFQYKASMEFDSNLKAKLSEDTQGKSSIDVQ